MSAASPVYRVLLPDCRKEPKPGDSGSQPGTPRAATGNVGSQPGTPGAATGQPGTWPGTTGSATGLLDFASNGQISQPDFFPNGYISAWAINSPSSTLSKLVLPILSPPLLHLKNLLSPLIPPMILVHS